MILLPRGNPVKEKVNPGKVNLPDALGKLQAAKYSGYLRFDFPDATGILIFEKGKLISALLEMEQGRLINEEAIARIFEKSVQGDAKLDIYRFSPELAMSIYALLHGDVLYKGQELKIVDIKALLGKVKEDKISGCLRIYTNEHVALIFYQEGEPLGFFHDGSTKIETEADTSMSVARLPGAKVDVLTTKDPEGLLLDDLMGSANIGELWQKTKESIIQKRRAKQEEASRNIALKEKERRQKILSFLQETAEAHIGKIGKSLVEKAFESVEISGGIISEDTLTEFYKQLDKPAKLVAGPSTVKNMIDKMKLGIADMF